MIKRYTDHSANERTYLAWIRTSIAIMTFGFLIEKFEIFLGYVGKATGETENYKSALSAELVGLSLFLIGFIVIIAATIRFFRYKDAIEKEIPMVYGVKRTNILLSALMIILSLFLLLYMGNQFFN
ncbi:MAG: YidH family protein [bacterium]